MARLLRGRLMPIVAAAAIAVGMLGGPFVGTAAAYTYPTHQYSSPKMWQCSDNNFQELTQCAWVQYTVAYKVTATDNPYGSTYYYVTPMWTSAYIWNGQSLGYNQWYGVIGAMHTNVDYYTPDGTYRGRWSLSPGYCGGTYPFVGGSDLNVALCTTTPLGINLIRTAYPFYGCFRTSFDSTLMYDSGFGYTVCFWVYL